MKNQNEDNSPTSEELKLLHDLLSNKKSVLPDEVLKFVESLLKKVEEDIKTLEEKIDEQQTDGRIVPDEIKRRQEQIDWYAERFNLN